MENFGNNELYHYGRKGMKWGQNIFGSDKSSGGSKGGSKGKNTKKKKTLKSVIKSIEAKKVARDKAKAKEAAKKRAEEEAKARVNNEKLRVEVAKSRSAQKVYENAHLFTTQELNDIYYRLNLEKNIKNLIPEKGKKGKKVADDVIDWSGKASQFIANGTKLYNQFAMMYNSFNKKGNSIPIIKGEAKKKESKSDASNDDDVSSKIFGSEAKTSAGKNVFKNMFKSSSKKSSKDSDDDVIYVKDEDIEIITPSSSKYKASTWTSNTSARSAGESYISQYLSLPAPTEDD